MIFGNEIGKYIVICPGPWDHSKRLEQLGSVHCVAIVDPLVKKAEEVLKEKKDGPYGHLYTHCKVMADYKELLLLDDKPDAVFIGMYHIIFIFITNVFYLHIWSLGFYFYLVVLMDAAFIGIRALSCLLLMYFIYIYGL